MRKFLTRDRVLGILLLAFSLLFAYYATGIKESNLVGDPGPRLFPYIGCFIVGICSLVLIVRRDTNEYKPYMTWEQWKRFGTLFGVYVLNYLALVYAGYKVAIPLTLALTCFLFSHGSNVALWKKIAYVVVASAVLMFCYVVLLETVLPRGKLGL